MKNICLKTFTIVMASLLFSTTLTAATVLSQYQEDALQSPLSSIVHYQSLPDSFNPLNEKPGLMSLAPNSSILAGKSRQLLIKPTQSQSSEYVQPSQRNKYIKRSDLPYSEDLFQSILRPRGAQIASSLSGSILTPDCNELSEPVLGSQNKDNLDAVNEGLSSRTQYCAYDLENSDRVGTSIAFCGCVREKTMQYGEDDGVVYSALKSNEEFKQAVDFFRQRFSDLVIKDIFNELEDMTNQANAFLSTAELADALYGKVKGKKEGFTFDMKYTREKMHSCSGPAMKDLVADMFHTVSGGETACDQQGAEILLESIKNFNSCGQENSSECDPLAEFASHDFYNDQPADKVISDLMSFHFSKGIIKPEDLIAHLPQDGSAFDKYHATLNLIASISDSDSDNNTVILRDRINFKNMLPSQEDLLAISHLYQQFETGGSIDLTTLSEIQIKNLSRSIAVNPLYQIKPVSQFEEVLPNSNNEGRLRQFIADLHADKLRRIEQNAEFSQFFDQESPLEKIKVIVLNNYLERGHDLGMRCEAVKDKVRSLCSSMKGNGISLFSHPDFREYAEDFIVDEELHQKLNEITGSERKRSPAVDQLFCHANYSSISNDCQESLRIQYNAQMSFNQCDYDYDWLLKDIDESLKIGSVGNFDNSSFFTSELLEQEYQNNKNMEEIGGVSGSAFASIVSTRGDTPRVYGIEKKELSGGFLENFQPSQQRVIASASDDKNERQDKKLLSAPAPASINSSASIPSESSSFAQNTRRSFSENFETSYSHQTISAPSVVSPLAQRVEQAEVPSQKQTNDLLLQELKESEAQQQKYLAQLSELQKVDSELSSTPMSKESELIKAQEKEVARLDEKVKNLRSQVRSRQLASKVESSSNDFDGQPAPQATPARALSKSSPAAPTVLPTSTPAAATNSVQAPSTLAASNDPLVTDSSPQRQNQSSPLALTAQSSFVAPIGTKLSALVTNLTGRDYVLRDVGIPGKAEKIVFKTENGEVVLVDGEPLVVSVELIDIGSEESLDGNSEFEGDALVADDIQDEKGTNERSPASEQREVFWDDVVNLLNNNLSH